MNLTELQVCFLVALFVILGCTTAVLVDLYYVRKRLRGVERNTERLLSAVEQKGTQAADDVSPSRSEFDEELERVFHPSAERLREVMRIDRETLMFYEQKVYQRAWNKLYDVVNSASVEKSVWDVVELRARMTQLLVECRNEKGGE